MATKLWHVPVRLATGAIILDQGLLKLDADEDTAKWLHGQAAVAFPQFAEMEPKEFVQLLSTGEIALGAALLGIGFVPSGLAGLALGVLRGVPDPAVPQGPGDAPRGHHRPQPAGHRPGQGLLDAGHRHRPGPGRAVRVRPQAPQEVLAPRGARRAPVCDSSGAMRVLAVVAVLTLAVAAPAAGAPSLASSGCPLFPADNVWHADVSRLPVHPRSGAYLAAMGAGAGIHADFGSGTWEGGPIGIPYTVVRAGQARVPVRFGYAGESDPGPYPIPPDAPVEGGPDAGGDRHVLVVQAGSCRLYELFDAHREGGGWRAGSGAVWDLRSNRLRPAGWTSADAAGLPILAGLVRYEEVARGRVDHAIRVTVDRSQASYLWPARHHAGQAGASLPPMGLRLRLRAGVEIGGFPVPGQGDPAGDADPRAGGGRQRLLGVHRRRARRALGQRRPPPAPAGHPGRLRGRRHLRAARLPGLGRRPRRPPVRPGPPGHRPPARPGPALLPGSAAAGSCPSPACRRPPGRAGAGPATAAQPGSRTGRRRPRLGAGPPALLPQVLTVVLGLIAAALAAREVTRRTRRPRPPPAAATPAPDAPDPDRHTRPVRPAPPRPSRPGAGPGGHEPAGRRAPPGRAGAPPPPGWGAPPRLRRAGGPGGRWPGGRTCCGGSGMFLGTPGVRLLGIVPVLLAGVLVLALLGLLVVYLDELADALTPFADRWDESSRTLVRVGTGLVVLLGSTALLVVSFTVICQIIGQPFYERISDRIEHDLGGPPAGADAPWWRTFPGPRWSRPCCWP